MTLPQEYAVSLQLAAPRTIAAVHARLLISAVPNRWRPYLDQVYASASSSWMDRTCSSTAPGKLSGARRCALCSHRLVPSARAAPCGPALGSVRTLDGGRNASADRCVLSARAGRAWSTKRNRGSSRTLSLRRTIRR